MNFTKRKMGDVYEESIQQIFENWSQRSYSAFVRPLQRQEHLPRSMLRSRRLGNCHNSFKRTTRDTNFTSGIPPTQPLCVLNTRCHYRAVPDSGLRGPSEPVVGPQEHPGTLAGAPPEANGQGPAELRALRPTREELRSWAMGPELQTRAQVIAAAP